MPIYPAHGDPRSTLARGLRPDPFLGTLGHFSPGLVPPLRPYVDLSAREKAVSSKIAKLIRDASDSMLIPRANGAHQLALLLTERLCDPNHFRMRMSIPYSMSHSVDPGAVLIGAIRDLTFAIRTTPRGKAPFDPSAVMEVSNWLGGYCELYPPEDDMRRLASHYLYALIQQLIAYYG